ncbi:hypothetical protein [Paenibacillus sedimenti]|uniref:Uncharacterized protein n=1 Tax=Paenibacillus sedimenti TaxID=2770274 RepID=A0A926KQ45_9BACL|nr:hypothetical protein [Paenibacillus sedimenti]MBD0381855.1 hypothetical protein [Paenibacillus sedimenti]
METVHLYNVEYWEIRNLEITNTGVEREAKRKGVFVQVHNFGTAHARPGRLRRHMAMEQR